MSDDSLNLLAVDWILNLQKVLDFYYFCAIAAVYIK